MMDKQYGTTHPEVGVYYRSLIDDVVGKVVSVTRYIVVIHKDGDPVGTNEIFSRYRFARYMVPVE